MNNRRWAIFLVLITFILGGCQKNIQPKQSLAPDTTTIQVLQEHKEKEQVFKSGSSNEDYVGIVKEKSHQLAIEKEDETTPGVRKITIKCGVQIELPSAKLRK
ncbi:hypothetical protein BHU72_01080 [Desulfuribacillus stibiiarsenatis]|uniref:Lipoprotein n=1 Tax=Desulfuribacillus stibiiarsenatis TaxID=1390249 RepID=A0A1E5L9R8_9FIRM|nr:hypothetical protein [Desulfuribacillus stibiiarsenatis]OEH86886.1 hypothetical protein BHU72_01080 [Desulfuribacillus stibiiarsenatis]